MEADDVESDELNTESEKYLANQLMPQALPVCAGADAEEDEDVEFDPKRPPASAFEYLQRVRAESEKCAGTCTVQYKERAEKQTRINRHQQYRKVDFSKSSAALLKMFSERDEALKKPHEHSNLSQDETDYIVALFDTSKTRLEQYKLSHCNRPDVQPEQSYHLPKLSDCDGWLKFCLSADVLRDMKEKCGNKHPAGENPSVEDGKSEEAVEGGSGAADMGEEVGKDGGSEASTSPRDDHDVESDGESSSSSEPPETPASDTAGAGSATDSLPVLSLIARLNQETVNTVIDHLSTLLRDGCFQSRLGNWLYVLLTSLPIPLPSCHVATLRQLARHCKQIRANLNPSEAESCLSGLNILITVISHNFGQKDLMD